MFKRIYDHLRNAIINWLTHEPPATEPMPYDFSRLKYEIRPGDVLLIQGRSRISGFIRRFTQSSWTHAALYIGRMIDITDDEIKTIVRQQIPDIKDTTRLLIEGLMDKGTVVTPLNSYRHHHIRICRPIGITARDVHLVIRYASGALGKPYNVRQLFDLARFLLPWSFFPRRWGSVLFRMPTGEPDSGVCSSLIAEAYSSVQFPILPFVQENDEKGPEVFHRNPYLYTPKDFDYSPYFEIIKYPIFNPDEPLPYYRRMPWTTSKMLHQDKGVLSVPTSKKNKMPGGDNTPPDEDTP